MDKELAKQIIERYAAVLGETEQQVCGVPESRLPCDQSLIKEAIKLYIKEVPEGSDAYHKLRAWYPKLAAFIPDDQAARSARAEAAMMSMDPMDEGFKYLDEHAAILQKIQADMYELTQELLAYLEGKAVEAAS
ncbi:MAG: hypothetical protein M1133_13970 [Armatimonadetes bacterium]|nr:hypothetical protein [Armatimonadota bacterium]